MHRKIREKSFADFFIKSKIFSENCNSYRKKRL